MNDRQWLRKMEIQKLRTHLIRKKLHVSLYISNAAAKITTAADPVRLSLFKTAPLAAGAGAPVGVAEIDEGGVAGAPAGDSGVDGGGEGGELAVVGERAEPLSGGEASGEFADGVAAGDRDLALRGEATGDLAGEEAGEDAGD